MGLDRTRSRLRFPGSSLLLFLSFTCGLFFSLLRGRCGVRLEEGGHAHSTQAFSSPSDRTHLCPLQWKHRVLTTGPTGNFPKFNILISLDLVIIVSRSELVFFISVSQNSTVQYKLLLMEEKCFLPALFSVVATCGYDHLKCDSQRKELKFSF